MKWIEVRDYEEMSQMAAQRLFEVISGRLAKRQKVRVGLATGNTMIRLYRILAEMLNTSGLRLDGFLTFNLDEYVDRAGRNIPPEHPLSYRKYMTDNFYAWVDTRLGFKRENMFFPDAENPAAFDARVADAGGLDFQLLGIGFNGHIAFNEPVPTGKIADADFAELPSRVIQLEERTLRANARLTADGDLSLVPRKAVTMGMRSILGANEIMLLACFKEQAAPLAEIKAGKLSTETPASFLLSHPSVQIIYTADTIKL